MEQDLKDCKQLVQEKTNIVNDLRKEYQDLASNNETQQKDVAHLQAEIAMASAERISMLRKCKLEETLLPLSRGGTIADIELDALQNADDSQDAMNVDVDLALDFKLISSLKNNPSQEKSKLELELRELNIELEHLGPQTRGPSNSIVEKTFEQTQAEYLESRDELKKVKSQFNNVKQKRLVLLN